jgi:hypothetical protein
MNSYGLEMAYRVNSQFTPAGWAGYSYATNLTKTGDKTGTAEQPGKAELFNWGIEAAFRDLGKRGSLLGLVVGQPPKVISDTYPNSGGAEKNTSYHYEVFYRYPVNENISVTPGLILITSPENNSANESALVGVIRTTFLF